MEKGKRWEEEKDLMKMLSFDYHSSGDKFSVITIPEIR